MPASGATWKLIVSSVPLGYFTGGGADAWSSANVLGFPRPGAGYRRERHLILETFRVRRVRNVVFLGGDVHHAEFIRHAPYPDRTFHELLAGPLAARQGYPHPLDRSLHSRSLGSLGWSYNFGEPAADGARLQARIVDASGAVRVAADVSAEPRRERDR